MTHRFLKDEELFVYDAKVVKEAIYKNAKQQGKTYTSMCYSIGLDGSTIAKSIDRYNRKFKSNENEALGVETMERIKQLYQLANIDIEKANIKPLKPQEQKPKNEKITKEVAEVESNDVLIRQLKNYISTQNTYLSILTKELEAIRGNQVEIIKMLEKK